MAKKRTGESLKDLFKEEVSSKESRRQNAQELKRQRAKKFKRQDVKTPKGKRKHTVYLSLD